MTPETDTSPLAWLDEAQQHKRKDLNHTGPHKINNTLGQIWLAPSMNKTRTSAETGA